MRSSLLCLGLMLAFVPLAMGCGGGGSDGGGSSSPTPTPSATATPTPSGSTPALTSVNFTSGAQNLPLIFHGVNLTWPFYRMTIGGVSGTLLENSNSADGTAVSGIVQPRPSSLSVGVAYPIEIFVSNDNVHFTQVSDPPGGPLTFTYTL